MSYPPPENFVPAQECGAILLPERVLIEEIKIRKASINQTKGLPVIGSLDVLRDLVHKKMRGEGPADPWLEAAPPGPVHEAVEPVPAVASIPIERAVAKKGPVPCEDRCRELEEENRALVRIVARLQIENDKLRASRA